MNARSGPTSAGDGGERVVSVTIDGIVRVFSIGVLICKVTKAPVPSLTLPFYVQRKER